MSIKLLAVLCWIIAFAESLGIFVSKVLSINNNFVFNFSFPVSVILFNFIIYFIIKQTDGIGIKWLFISSLLFLVFSVVNLLIIQGLYNQNYYTMLVGYLLNIFWCLLAILCMIKKTSYDLRLNNPAIWVVLGIIVPAISSLLYRSLIMIEYSGKIMLFKMIIIGMAVFRYSCFIITFIISTSFKNKFFLQSGHKLKKGKFYADK